MVLAGLEGAVTTTGVGRNASLSAVTATRLLALVVVVVKLAEGETRFRELRSGADLFNANAKGQTQAMRVTWCGYLVVGFGAAKVAARGWGGRTASGFEAGAERLAGAAGLP